MRKLSRQPHIYSMGPHNPPAYEINLGGTVVVETWDAFAGKYTEPDGGQSVEDKVEPATGTIAIRGFEPGNNLAIEILGLKPVGTGILRSGSLLKKISIIGDYAFFDDLKLRMKPMIGVIGVAPSEEEIDCSDV